MNKAFLLLGGNLGDREKNLEVAREYIQQRCGAIIRLSALYETAAWGKRGQPSFLNQAVEIDTNLSAGKLMKQILNTEKMMGRQRKGKFDPRVIDIDILFFNLEQYDLSNLKIPHPELQNRRFALIPLAEIAGDLQHPLFRKTVSQLLKDCPDKLEVKKYHGLKIG